MDIFSLQGKTALVTGGTRGIGAQMAIALAEAGADIILVQRDERNNSVKTLVENLGRRVAVYVADLSSQESTASLIPRILKDQCSIDILLNCAGVQKRHASHTFPTKDFEQIMQVNLGAVFTISRDVGAHMLSREPDAFGCRGKIIQLASILSFNGGETVSAYAASKGGVAQLTKALSNEWASQGINVNAIAPGYVATEMNEDLLQDAEEVARTSAIIPAGRWGVPEDFKGITIFLASRASAYVSGAIILVDGGWVCR